MRRGEVMRCAPVSVPWRARHAAQVRGESVSTASDVYTLGVILYELLTGHHPYLLAGKGAMEKARIVLDAQPTRPSLVLRQTEEAPPEAAAARNDVLIANIAARMMARP